MWRHEAVEKLIDRGLVKKGSGSLRSIVFDLWSEWKKENENPKARDRVRGWELIDQMELIGTVVSRAYLKAHNPNQLFPLGGFSFRCQVSEEGHMDATLLFMDEEVELCRYFRWDRVDVFKKMVDKYRNSKVFTGREKYSALDREMGGGPGFRGVLVLLEGRFDLDV